MYYSGVWEYGNLVVKETKYVATSIATQQLVHMKALFVGYMTDLTASAVFG